MIAEEYDLHRLIHALEIGDQVFHRIIRLMNQGKVLIHIVKSSALRSHFIGIEVGVIILISSVILHGNAHDKEIFIFSLLFVAIDNLIEQFLIRDVISHNIGLIKIPVVHEILFIKSQLRIIGVSLPPCGVIRMHGNRGISPGIQGRHHGEGIFLKILLINHRSGRKPGHGISCHVLPFGIRRLGAVHR